MLALRKGLLHSAPTLSFNGFNITHTVHHRTLPRLYSNLHNIVPCDNILLKLSQDRLQTSNQQDRAPPFLLRVIHLVLQLACLYKLENPYLVK